MSQHPRQPIQNCPICGVAMLGSKSSEHSPRLDTFTCLRCDAVMTLGPTTDPSPRNGNKPG
jgi:hypothetical protein